MLALASNFMPDTELINKAKSGDSQAFATLYEEFSDKIYYFVYSKTGSEALAEDLTQQTFLNAWRSIQKMGSEDLAFSAWIYRIAQNLVIDHYRKHDKNISIDILENSLLEYPEFEERAASTEELAEILASLEPLEKEIVSLRFIEGLNLEEISQKLGKSKGAVSTIQYRALKKIKERKEK